ncbi:MAG: TRAP transporter small permease [Deltaproteobacteria bacterium]|nr:TRAP transporter small permease [Deltaproteobacteria bacterium]
MKYILKLFALFRASCAVMVVVMMAMVVLGVALRSLRIGYIPANEEFIEFFVALTIYLGAAPLQQEKGHIRVRLVTDFLPGRLKSLAEVVAWIFFLIFFIIILWQGWEMALNSYSSGERFQGVVLPVYPVRFGLVLGCLFMVIQLFVDLVLSLREFAAGEQRR